MKMDEDYKHVSKELFEKTFMENATKKGNNLIAFNRNFLKVKKISNDVYCVWMSGTKNFFPPKLLFYFDGEILMKISMKSRIVPGVLFNFFFFFLFFAVFEWNLNIQIKDLKFLGFAFFIALLIQLILFYFSRGNTIDEVEEQLGII